MNIEELKKLKKKLISDKKEYVFFNGNTYLDYTLESFVQTTKGEIDSSCKQTTSSIKSIENLIEQKLRNYSKYEGFESIGSIYLKGNLLIATPKENLLIESLKEKFKNEIDPKCCVINFDCKNLKDKNDVLNNIVAIGTWGWENPEDFIIVEYDSFINALRKLGYRVTAPETFNDLKGKILNNEHVPIEIIADLSEKLDRPKEKKLSK